MAPTPSSDEHPAIALARRYLVAMEAGDLDEAHKLLAADAAVTFPSGARLAGVGAIAAATRRRYRACNKTFERFDVVERPRGAVVYCIGTLSGAWADGTEFAGIRFIDRFEIEDGAIVRQEVWNDSAYVRPPG